MENFLIPIENSLIRSYGFEYQIGKPFILGFNCTIIVLQLGVVICKLQKNILWNALLELEPRIGFLNRLMIFSVWWSCFSAPECNPLITTLLRSFVIIELVNRVNQTTRRKTAMQSTNERKHIERLNERWLYSKRLLRGGRPASNWRK